ITFNPLDGSYVGTNNGQLLVESNDPLKPQLQISLTGQGVTGILAAIETPTDGQAVRQTVSISGRAKVAGGVLATWILDYTAGEQSSDSATYHNIDFSTQTVEQGLLASWDTSQLTDGPYTLRLRVTDDQQIRITQRRLVQVDNTAPYPPVLQISSDPGDQSLTTNGATISLSGNLMSEVSLTSAGLIDQDGKQVQDLSAAITFSGTSLSGQFQLAEVSAGQVQVSMVIQDPAGNQSTAGLSNRLQVDNQGPGVRIQNPTWQANFRLMPVQISGQADEDAQQVEIKIDGQDWQSVSGLADWNYSYQPAMLDSSHSFQLRASDGVGNVGDIASSQFTSFSFYPALNLSEPAANQSIDRSQLEIRGLADGNADQQYQLAYRLVGEESWHSIQQGTVLTSAEANYGQDRKLADWLPPASGNYILKLTVGNLSIQRSDILIVNPGQVGPVEPTPVEPELLKVSVNIQPGLNLIGLPLQPESEWRLPQLLAALPADFLFYYDGSAFQYYGGGESAVVVEGGVSYVVVRNQAGSASVELSGQAWDNVNDGQPGFRLTLQPAINMISVPLQPQSGDSFNLQQLFEQLPIDFLFYYDGSGFQYYNGGVIDQQVTAGRGYVALNNSDQAVEYIYRGSGWQSSLSVAPAIWTSVQPASDQQTGVMAIVGQLDLAPEMEVETDQLQLQLINRRSGQSWWSSVSAQGGFSWALINWQQPDLIRVDDQLAVEIDDGRGGRYQPLEIGEVRRSQIQAHRIELGRVSLEALPQFTTLAQNYPNPFNPETWMPFQLSQDSSVRIEIYSAQGRRVRQLDLGWMEAGVYNERPVA
ncbi:MAG: hypothetical protein QGG54_11335, partial [Gammaproteobacteria bacterium]|nr:hypothetical protein [Gammaproteobacteria bacterium]